MMKKQIPTILGLLILVGALIAGLIFFGEGTGVFAPRATPETTPKQIRVTNIKDNSFTVSFYTEEKTAAFVKYGTDPNKLNSQVSDDRDQLSGAVGEYQLHHITVRGLDPATDYYYVLGTGSRAEFDNEGQPFQITTAVKPSAPPPEAKTVYGSVSNENGTPAEGSIVYLAADGMGDASSLVKASGSWAVPLSQMRTTGGDGYADLEDNEQLSLLVQGAPLTKRIQIRLTAAEAQPVPELTFGKKPDLSKTSDVSAETSPTPSPDPALADQPQPQEQDSEASISGQLQNLLDEAEPLPTDSTASSELLVGELKTSTESGEISYTTESPKIKGKAKPNTEVKIEVHSDNQYEQTVTSDEDGYFELDLEALKATLEPGEHTVTYSYLDPDTGEEVIETETFWVEDSDSVKLAQGDTDSTSTTSNSDSDTSETGSDTTSTLDSEASLTSTPTPTSSIPYGSGSPYPMTTPTSMPTSTPTPISATSSSTATSSTTGARQQPLATDSSPQAGSIEATLLLVIGGMFFILMGGWSWWLASELDE